jgi:hypothetical protein
MILLYNIYLIHLLIQRNRLKANISMTLMFNVFSTLPMVVLSLGFILITLSVDERMYFESHLRAPLLALELFCFQLSSAAVGLYWIQISEKVDSRKNFPLKYKLFLYGSTVVYVLISSTYFAYYHTLGPVSVLGPLIDVVTFHYGGRVVASKLRSISSSSVDVGSGGGGADVFKEDDEEEEDEIDRDLKVIHEISHIATTTVEDIEHQTLKHKPPTSPSRSHVKVNAMELANAVQSTSQVIVNFNIGLVMSALCIILTIMSSNPFYPQQNHLPRWCQGQLAMFTVMHICLCVWFFNFFFYIYISVYSLLC